MDAKVQEYRNEYQRIPGWLGPLEFDIFDWCLSYQEREGITGDLLEIGSYQGQSSVLIGLHRQLGEKLTVCDLFGSAVTNSAESYRGLSLDSFLTNYRRYCDEDPEIVAESSLLLRGKVSQQSCRFIHIDGGHNWEAVSEDIITAVSVAAERCIIAVDDFRAAHTPAVGLAVWRAVSEGSLRPFCVTNQKLYATIGHHNDLVSSFGDWVVTKAGLRCDRVRILDYEVAVVLPPPPRAGRAIGDIVRDRLVSRLRHLRNVGGPSVRATAG